MEYKDYDKRLKKLCEAVNNMLYTEDELIAQKYQDEINSIMEQVTKELREKMTYKEYKDTEEMNVVQNARDWLNRHSGEYDDIY